jgi:hypothetical protein
MPHAATHRSTKAKPSSSHRWSQHVTETSDALDLPKDIFKQADPRRIAADLKRSAEHSRRRHAEPYRSAMSMLTFYLNRAGKTLGATQKRRLEAAKDELRDLFGRPRRGAASSGARR